MSDEDSEDGAVEDHAHLDQDGPWRVIIMQGLESERQDGDFGQTCRD